MDFTNQEVKKIIRCMENNKATGFDSVPAEARKEKRGNWNFDGFI
jgi:hypothetical protein